MNAEQKVMYDKVRGRGEQIVNTAEELVKFYRPGRIEGNLLEYINEDVQKYGYTLCTRHSSITGENVWFFPKQ